MPVVNVPTVIALPFSTIDPNAEHRLKGLTVACASINGQNCYLCHDGVFRGSALPLDMQAADRETALDHSESAFFEDKQAIASLCEQQGWPVNSDTKLPKEQPRKSADSNGDEESERAMLKKLLAKYGTD